MRVVIVCAALAIAATGVAFAKEKKVAVSDATALCSTKHSSKRPRPELDCNLTGTAKLPDGTKPDKPHLGYDTNPWIITGP